MDPVSCLNCDAPLAGNYCAACGQTAHTHRYTLGHIGHEVFHSVTHTDKSALVFLREIVVRPGEVARDLFAGKRKKYFSVFTFFLLCTAFYTVSEDITHFYDSLRTQTVTNSRMPAIMKEAFDLMSKHGKLTGFLFLPINALLTMAFFRKYPYNYAEHLVFNTLIFSVYIMTNGLLMPLVWVNTLWAKHISNLVQLLYVVMMTIGCRQLFRNNWVVTFLKTVLMRVLQVIAVWIIALGIVFLGHQL